MLTLACFLAATCSAAQCDAGQCRVEAPPPFPLTSRSLANRGGRLPVIRPDRPERPYALQRRFGRGLFRKFFPGFALGRHSRGDGRLGHWLANLRNRRRGLHNDAPPGDFGPEVTVPNEEPVDLPLFPNPRQ